jgi:hypothetical protein
VPHHLQDAFSAVFSPRFTSFNAMQSQVSKKPEFQATSRVIDQGFPRLAWTRLGK